MTTGLALETLGPRLAAKMRVLGQTNPGLYTEITGLQSAGGRKPMQCKDIEDGPLLAFIAGIEAEKGSWVLIWDFDGTPYGELPYNLLRAKMAKLIKRCLITGCTCGCRGDFQITKKGRAYLWKDAADNRIGEPCG